MESKTLINQKYCRFISKSLKCWYLFETFWTSFHFIS